MSTQWDEARARAEFHNKEDLDLLLRKAADYSTNNIHAVGAAGIASRLVDKFARLSNLLATSGSDRQIEETVDETLSDAQNYCTMLRLKRAGKWPRMIRSVYVAGPIDNANGPVHLGMLLIRLVNCKIAAYVPREAFNGASFAPDVVADINRAAIRKCDAMLVYWPDPCPSFGTGRDVEYARLADKPVFVVAPWCRSTELQDCQVYSSIEECIQAMAP